MTAPRPADARGNGGHTPGPWEVVETDDGHEIRMGTALGNPSRWETQHVVEMRHCLDPDDDAEQWDEAVATLHVAAAAPVMFEALTALVQARRHADECGCDDDCDVALDLWRTVDRLSVAALTAASPAPDADAGEVGHG